MTPVRLLDATTRQRLQQAELTYPEVGQALTHRPPGYRHITETHELPPGTTFDDAAAALMTWQVQSRAGLQVAASNERIILDGVVVLRLGVGRLSLATPCRVVTVIDEPDRRGFAYGTLPGHPERGEEAFELERQRDGRIAFTITAFSRPATVLARLGGPLSTGVQTLVTRRYLRSLD